MKTKLIVIFQFETFMRFNVLICLYSIFNLSKIKNLNQIINLNPNYIVLCKISQFYHPIDFFGGFQSLSYCSEK